MRLPTSPLRRALALALAFALGAAWPALAQVTPGAGQLAVRSDGFIFWIANGLRHPVYPTSLTDEQLNALPEGVSLNGALQPAPPPVAAQSAEGVTVPGPPPGTSRASALQQGQPCRCFLPRGNQRSELEITVAEVERNAWPRLKATNLANPAPRDGFEYLMVSLVVRYVNGPTDLPISIDRYDFSVLDANDSMYMPAFVVEPNPLFSVSAFPGAEVVGSVAYQVPKNDPGLILVWRYNDPSPTWFGLTP